MNKEYSIELLNKNSVNINIQHFANVEGETYLIRREGISYSNSPIGRMRVVKEVPEEFVNAIFALWGDTPTVADPPYAGPSE